MNKAEFIGNLRHELKGIPENEIDDILYDYEEHFQIGLSKGKTEEEIAMELGNPITIGKSYRANYKINNAESNPSTKNLFTAIISAVSLGFFNLIFVLGPFLAIVGLLIGLYVVGISFIVCGISLFFGTLLIPFHFISIDINVHPITSASFGIGFATLGILILIGSFYLTKKIYNLILKYLRWNINTITK